MPTSSRRRPGCAATCPPLLLLLAAAALVVALARPQRTRRRAAARRHRVLVNDVSGSMRADDVDPNRLTAAVESAKVLLDKTPGQLPPRARHVLGLRASRSWRPRRTAAR